MTDDPLDEPFHAHALSAFITVAREQQGWPDPEKTRRRAYNSYEAMKREEQPVDAKYTEEALRRMGIDPASGKDEIIRQLQAKYDSLVQAEIAQRSADTPVVVQLIDNSKNLR